MTRGWFANNHERQIAEPRTVTQCPVCGLENNRVLFPVGAPTLYQDCGHTDDEQPEPGRSIAADLRALRGQPVDTRPPGTQEPTC